MGLGHLRGRATDHVPTARIRHEETAIRIFNHIRGMEIGLITLQKDARLCRVGRSRPGQPVPRQASQVEVGAKQITPETEHITSGHHDPRWSRGAHLGKNRQQPSRTGMWCEHTIVRLAVHPSMDGMENAIPFPGTGQVKKGAAQEPLPRPAECQPHGIVHSACNHHFQTAAVGPGAIDMGGA